MAVTLLAVCCEGDDVLAVYELASGDRVGLVPVGEAPVHAARCSGRLFVATMGERSVNAVDLDGRTQRVPTGVLGPSHLTCAAGTLFVPCTAGDVVAAIDPEALTLLERIPVGAEPHEIAGRGDVLYVGSRRDGRVDAIDARQLSPRDSVSLGREARIQGVAVLPDGTGGLAVDQQGDRAFRFRLEPPMRVEAEAAVGENPYDFALRSDRLYVPGRADGTVHELHFDLSTVAVHRGFDRPYDVRRVGGEEWVVDRAASRLRSLSGREVDIPAPVIAAESVGDRLVLSHYDDDAISLVDPSRGVLWTRETPAHPFGILAV